MVQNDHHDDDAASYNQRITDEVRLIWHRRDLRLHDNELYINLDENVSNSDTAAIRTTKVVSLYIFDDQYFKPTSSTIKGSGYDTIWCGPHATQAIIEAVTVLRNNLQSIGGELVIRRG